MLRLSRLEGRESCWTEVLYKLAGASSCAGIFQALRAKKHAPTEARGGGGRVELVFVFYVGKKGEAVDSAEWQRKHGSLRFCMGCALPTWF